MPELPEVETVVRTLKPQVVGRRIRDVQLGPHRLRQAWKKPWKDLLIDCTIVDLVRRGKWILLELSRLEHRLVVHLGMTGRLYVMPASAERAKHTHFVFPLDRGAEELRFLDPRRFGSVTVARNQGEHRFPAEAELGPEPFELEHIAFFESLRRSKRNLKALLLDQTLVAGVGNIYADESLFEARLPPTKLGTKITPEEAERLRKAISKVLRKAIESKGSTIANYYYGDGKAGGYQKEFRVYDQTGEPCRRCKTPIEQIRLAGRSTHFCPVCQATSSSTRHLGERRRSK